MDRTLVADISFPSPDRAGIRRVSAATTRFVVRPARPQELLENLVVSAVIEARDLQIALRLRRDALAPLRFSPAGIPTSQYASSSHS